MRSHKKCIILFACHFVTKFALVEAQTASQVSPEILAATRPLHREIGALKEQLDTMEAKHDTLEAATEQFRLKAKSYKENLEDEKKRSKELIAQKAELEDRHNKEIESWTKRHADAVAQVSSLEIIIRSLQTDQRTKEEDFQNAMAGRDAAVAEVQGQMEHASAEIAQLRSSILDRKSELSEVNNENVLLQQELNLLKKKIRKLEEKSKLSMWELFWQEVAESRVGATLMDLSQEYWEWFEDDLLPVWTEHSAVLSSTVQQKLVVLHGILAEKLIELPGQIMFASEFVKGAADRLRNADLKNVYTPFLQLCSKAGDRSASVKPVVTASPYLDSKSIVSLKRMFSRLAGIHGTTAMVLEWLATAFTSYYTTEMNGSRDDWLYTACLSVKAHSSHVLLFIEIAMGLILLDFALTMANRVYVQWTNGARRGRVRQVTIIPKGSNQSRSLLRTAGGPSVRSQ